MYSSWSVSHIKAMGNATELKQRLEKYDYCIPLTHPQTGNLYLYNAF